MQSKESSPAMLQQTLYIHTPLPLSECVERLGAKIAAPDDWLATTQLIGKVSTQGFRLKRRRGLVFFWLNPMFIGTFQSTGEHTTIHLIITIPFHEKLLVICFPVLMFILALLLSSIGPLFVLIVMALLTGLFYKIFCGIRDVMLKELRDTWGITDSITGRC